MPVSVKRTAGPSVESKVEKYALLALAAAADIVLAVGTAVNQLPPAQALKWGAIATAALGVAHALLAGLKENAKGNLAVAQLAAPTGDLTRLAAAIVPQAGVFNQDIKQGNTSSAQGGVVAWAPVVAAQAAQDLAPDLANVEQLLKDSEASVDPPASLPHEASGRPPVTP